MAEINYGHDTYNFEDFMRDLIDGYADGSVGPKHRENLDTDARISANDFSGAVIDGLQKQSEDLWQDILKYLKSESSPSKSPFIRRPVIGDDGEYESEKWWDLPMHKEDDNWKGVFEFIADNADLDDEAFEQLKDHVADLVKQVYLLSNQGETDNDNFWNKSVHDLIKKYLENFDYDLIKQVEKDIVTDEINENVLETNGRINMGKNAVSFRITDMVNSDAGYSFFQNQKWVRPWFNIDQKTYKGVRGIDKMMPAITSDRELQFTRTKEGHQEKEDDKYTRLIMPKYLRRVEVEDLNRNFWVIGQALSGICAFVFDRNSPLVDILKGLIGEIVGLWENIFYLWIEMAAYAQKNYNDVKIIYVPVPNNEFFPYNKFDNFFFDYNKNFLVGSAYTKDDIKWEEMQKIFQYYVDQYKEANLVIIPEVRCQNYFRNYYYKVVYPGYLYYDRNENSWSYKNFNGDGGKLPYFSLKETPLAGGICQYNNKYYYMKFQQDEETRESHSKVYYDLLRITPKNIEWDSEAKKLSKLELKCEDIGAKLCGISNSWIVALEDLETGGCQEVRQINDVLEGSHNIENGFYLGELVSYYKRSLGEIIETHDDPILVNYQEVPYLEGKNEETIYPFFFTNNKWKESSSYINVLKNFYGMTEGEMENEITYSTVDPGDPDDDKKKYIYSNRITSINKMMKQENNAFYKYCKDILPSKYPVSGDNRKLFALKVIAHNTTENDLDPETMRITSGAEVIPYAVKLYRHEGGDKPKPDILEIDCSPEGTVSNDNIYRKYLVTDAYPYSPFENTFYGMFTFLTPNPIGKTETDEVTGKLKQAHQSIVFPSAYAFNKDPQKDTNATTTFTSIYSPYFVESNGDGDFGFDIGNIYYWCFDLTTLAFLNREINGKKNTINADIEKWLEHEKEITLIQNGEELKELEERIFKIFSKATIWVRWLTEADEKIQCNQEAARFNMENYPYTLITDDKDYEEYCTIEIQKDYPSSDSNYNPKEDDIQMPHGFGQYDKDIGGEEDESYGNYRDNINKYVIPFMTKKIIEKENNFDIIQNYIDEFITEVYELSQKPQE